MSPRSTSKRSAKSSKAKKAARPSGGAVSEGPFDPAIESRARQLADHYTVLVEATDDGGYTASCVEMPGGFAHASTRDAAMKKLREHLWLLPATLIELGQNPPEPSSSSNRTSQLNVRLSSMEKARLESAARRKGFRGVSDFVRSVALDNCD